MEHYEEGGIWVAKAFKMSFMKMKKNTNLMSIFGEGEE